MVIGCLSICYYKTTEHYRLDNIGIACVSLIKRTIFVFFPEVFVVIYSVSKKHCTSKRLSFFICKATSFTAQKRVNEPRLCEPSEDSNQLVHSHSLIRILTGCISDSQVSSCGQ